MLKRLYHQHLTMNLSRSKLLLLKISSKRIPFFFIRLRTRINDVVFIFPRKIFSRSLCWFVSVNLRLAKPDPPHYKEETKRLFTLCTKDIKPFDNVSELAVAIAECQIRSYFGMEHWIVSRLRSEYDCEGVNFNEIQILIPLYERHSAADEP